MEAHICFGPTLFEFGAQPGRVLLCLVRLRPPVRALMPTRTHNFMPRQYLNGCTSRACYKSFVAVFD